MKENYDTAWNLRLEHGDIIEVLCHGSDRVYRTYIAAVTDGPRVEGDILHFVYLSPTKSPSGELSVLHFLGKDDIITKDGDRFRRLIKAEDAIPGLKALAHSLHHFC